MILHHRLQWPFVGNDSSTQPEHSFGHGISPENLRITKSGGVHVSLADNWAGLAQSLSSLGEVLSTTSNAAASLTQLGRYPKFDICACGNGASNCGGGLGFDFEAWSQVWAAQEKRADEVWRSLSIFGESGLVNHQVMLVGQEAKEQFTDLTCTFQGKISPFSKKSCRNVALDPSHSECNDRQGYLELFKKRKHDFVENGKSGAYAVCPPALVELWQSVLAIRLWISTTVFTSPVVQSTIWQPTSFLEKRDTLTISTGAVLFQCQYEQIAELWVVPMPMQSGSAFALEAYNKEDHLLFAMAVPEEWREEWMELLYWMPKI